LVFLDIYGGEPFLSKELFDTLDKSPSPENTSLQLHTNITTYNEKYLEILSKYKSVKIGLSIDSHIPDQLNYIRYPVNADEILENLQKFKNFFVDNSNVNLNIALTINNLNIFNIDESFTKLSNYGIAIGYNFVSYPREYDIRTLPSNVKSEILNKNPNFKKDFSSYILQNIDNADIHFKKFWQMTKDLDSFRNQSFEKLFPDYYRLLAPHL
jgi:sulfatase maturation enzyme AslB (radical SAM superfamily)